MYKTMRIALCALFLLSLPLVANADYQTEKDNQNLDVIERALKKFKPDSSIFDGTQIVAGATPSAIEGHFKLCNDGVAAYTRYFKQLSAKGKAMDRAKALTLEAQQRQKYCVALATAGDAYIKTVNDAANARASAAKANEDMCFKLYREASTALPKNAFFDTLDTYNARRTMVGGEGMGDFKDWVNSLAGVCKKPEYKGATESCKRIGIISSSATNARYDYSDICSPAADVQKTLSDAAMRSLVHLSKDHQTAPDLRSFRTRDGWLRTEDAFSYKTFFTVTDKVKERLRGQATEVFGAAGVPVPDDLSVLWKEKQAYLDTMKGLVDQTIDEWKVNYSKCKGYGCNLAKNSLVKAYKELGGANVKSIYGSNDWKIHKNALGVPLERTVSVTIVFQVKGDPSCQARSFSVHETYKGGGKYKKAQGVNWGYGRFQSCNK